LRNPSSFDPFDGAQGFGVSSAERPVFKGEIEKAPLRVDFSLILP